MSISRRSIEEVRQRASLLEVAGAIVSLKRQGRNYVGLSPFKSEKTPSFNIWPEKNIFKCFSSGEGGDVIRFVELTENLRFAEAVEALAKRFGIRLEYEGRGPTKEEQSQRQLLLNLHEDVCVFYHRLFLGDHPLAPDIRRYWVEERKFTMEVARQFHIGFAPPDGGELAAFLKKCGYPPEVIRSSGLFAGTEKNPDPLRWWVRFRGRLMIPIRDVQGQVVAFTARKTAVTPPDTSDANAKYINSPETEIFKKSRLIFNLDRARLAIKPNVPFLVVEGQLDAIRAYTSGLETTVALQGSACNEEQVRTLARYKASRLEVLLDGDEAGQKAAARIIPLALQAGIEIRLLALPMGVDPDLLLREGGQAAWKKIAETPLTPLAYLARLAIAAGAVTQLERNQALRQLFGTIAETSSEMDRTFHLEEAARNLGVPMSEARRDFQTFLTDRRAPPSPTVAPPAPIDPLTTAESALLYLVLHHQEAIVPLSEHMEGEWIDLTHAAGILLSRLIALAREGEWVGLDAFTEMLETNEEKNTYFGLLALQRPIEDPGREINEAVRQLVGKFCTRQMQINRQQMANLKYRDPRYIELSKSNQRLSKLSTQPDFLTLDQIKPIGPVS